MPITVSCDEDVEEAGEDEFKDFVDRPGATNGTQLVSFAIDSFAIFGEMWFLSTGSVVGIPMIFAELPE